jgi:hypothetical protein
VLEIGRVEPSGLRWIRAFNAASTVPLGGKRSQLAASSDKES